MEKTSKSDKIIKFENKVRIVSAAGVVGKKEHEGPLSSYFDYHDPSDMFGQSTFEQAESEMQRLSMNLAMSKNKMNEAQIGAAFAGDLLNQCVGSSYGLAEFKIPFFGLYGACSTAAEALILGAVMVNHGIYDTVSTTVSSHNCSAERQFRFPLEYGSQRPPSSQWTVTGAGTFILSNSIEPFHPKYPYIKEGLPGRIIDKGINDANNMGAAMAPAAADTILRYFKMSSNTPKDFDLIITGDLGEEGHSICSEILSAEGLQMSENFTDCGMLIFNPKTQDTHSGGSGCGCSSVVTASYIMKRFMLQEIRNVLLIGTGALMNPSLLQQGLNIAGIGHLVHISAE